MNIEVLSNSLDLVPMTLEFVGTQWDEEDGEELVFEQTAVGPFA